MGAPAPSSMHSRAVDRLRDQGPFAARILLIAAIGWQLALWAGAHNPPIYAALAPLMALRSDPFSSMTAVVMRVGGVMAGVALGLSLVTLLSPTLPAVVLVLGLALLIGIYVGPGTALNPQVGLSSLLVLSNPAPDAYGIARVWETALGGLATIVLAPLLWPPHPRRELEAIARDCSTRLSAALRSSVGALGDPSAARANRMLVADEAERLRHCREQSDQAQHAMRFNPLHRRDRKLVAHLAGRVRTVAQTAPYVDLLAVEADALSTRDGPSPVLLRAKEELPAIVEATARTIESMVRGREPDADAAAARRLLDRYRETDPQAMAVALRRPFHKILDACVPLPPLSAPPADPDGPHPAG
ncbi:hypothetical protein OG435_33820 [Streptomyces sp. NBC_01264]|nr:hypothetical protein [Streptomyces sp. NBC_01264]